MSASDRTRLTALAAFTTWRARQWAVAVAAALGCVVLVGVPTDLIETPLFSRAVPPTWWSYPILAVSALLAGLLVATYVSGPTGVGPRNDGRWGGFGGPDLLRRGLPGLQQSRAARPGHLRCTAAVLRALATTPRSRLSGPAGLGAAPAAPHHQLLPPPTPIRPVETARAWQRPPAPRRCPAAARAVRTGRVRCSRR